MPRPQNATWPVLTIPTDSEVDSPRPGIALCLSGGGFRAMLFHLGSLWRLNQLGYLPKLDRVSSVSGGSITAGVLGLNWARLQFDAAGVSSTFESVIVRAIRSLADTTIDVPAIGRGLLGLRPVANQIADAYRSSRVFGRSTLQALPDDPPRFVINATNVQSGALWRFSKPYMWDYRVGKIEHPNLELAVAVAASSAFPPFLSPLIIDFAETDYVPGTGLDLQRPPFTTRVTLTDGGVYDNLGLETAWKNYQTILVSDGGGKMQPEATPSRLWPSHTLRVLSMFDNQVRSLRYRALIHSYRTGARQGAYWGIRTDITEFNTPNALTAPLEQTTRLAGTPTRLARLPAVLQERLINWGYAVCDAAIRKYVNPNLPAPAGFPYPGSGVG